MNRIRYRVYDPEVGVFHEHMNLHLLQDGTVQSGRDKAYPAECVQYRTGYKELTGQHIWTGDILLLLDESGETTDTSYGIVAYDEENARFAIRQVDAYGVMTYRPLYSRILCVGNVLSDISLRNMYLPRDASTVDLDGYWSRYLQHHAGLKEGEREPSHEVAAHYFALGYNAALQERRRHQGVSLNVEEPVSDGNRGKGKGNTQTDVE